MSRVPYRHQPGEDFLTATDIQHIHETMLRILKEIGLALSHDDLLAQMQAKGFRTRGERLYFEPAVVEEYLAEHRRRREAEEALAPAQPADDRLLKLNTGEYAHHVHDLETDRIVPYSSEKLVEMTKLVDVLSERGVESAAPGYPLDVPPQLQSLAQYRIGASYSRYGHKAVDPISLEPFPYVYEMAEVMGDPITSLPVYVFSPLRLAGESLDMALRYAHCIKSIHVSNMVSVGGTAPGLPFGALAMAAAESIGGYIVLSALTGLPVNFGIGLHAFDLRYGTMVFGSPEAFLLGQLNFEINRFYGSGRRRGRGSAAAGIHVRANFPGPQSAAEKASIMTAGALIGARRFRGAGILSLDEVFSAEQLLVDCEIKDQVQRLINGLDTGTGDYDWVEEIRQGLDHSFLAVRSTVDNYRQTYWHPQLFDRGLLSTQGSEGRDKLAKRARAMVQEYLSQHEYELDADRRREMDRIWEQAKRELV